MRSGHSRSRDGRTRGRNFEGLNRVGRKVRGEGGYAVQRGVCVGLVLVPLRGHVRLPARHLGYEGHEWLLDTSRSTWGELGGY